MNALFASLRRRLRGPIVRLLHAVKAAQGTGLPVYLGNGRALIRLYEGSPFVVDTASLDLAAPLILSARWEPWIEGHLVAQIRQIDSPTIVDVGANIGYYSVVLGRSCANATIWAFEPNSRLFGILRENLLINGIGREHCHKMALGSREETLTLRFGAGESGGGHLARHRPLEWQQSEAVRVAPLDEIMPPGTRVDLIKIDVEGFEPEVLAGAKRVLQENPEIRLVIELTPSAWRQNGLSPEDTLSRLEEIGFEFQLMMASSELVPMRRDELITAADQLPYVTCFLASRGRDPG